MLGLALQILDDHPWRFDLAALVALVSGLATALLALFTWRVARSTRELARSTEDDVSGGFRPVVVPVEPGMRVDLGTDVAGARIGTVNVDVENVGNGPALNLQVWIGANLEPEPEPDETFAIALGSLKPRGSSAISATTILSWPGTTSITVVLWYHDLAGRLHKTRAAYMVGPHQTAPSWLNLGLISTRIDPGDPSIWAYGTGSSRATIWQRLHDRIVRPSDLWGGPPDWG